MTFPRARYREQSAPTLNSADLSFRHSRFCCTWYEIFSLCTRDGNVRNIRKLPTCPVQNRYSPHRYEYTYGVATSPRISPSPTHSSVEVSLSYQYPAVLGMALAPAVVPLSPPLAALCLRLLRISVPSCVACLVSCVVVFSCVVILRHVVMWCERARRYVCSGLGFMVSVEG